ncbi:MAG: HAD-IIA family hydrolase [Dictyoglomus sp.]|nr:HAD-IIA family hydrolase [Dictyoglomus sp.]MCX7942219.1 HAD-IIA family hydrolase [Dictyoglomaceae bacterium]MDW8188682.1 HAD-IIA family hydrolase [Dictyoglomus sp.]
MLELRNIKGFLIDLDGCIYRGNNLLPSAKEFIDFLHRKTIRILFVTNNSTHLPIDYCQKLRNMGIEVNEEEFLTSGIATAIYLKKWKKKGKAYVIGEDALKEAIMKIDWEISDEDVDAVVVGLDRNFTFDKLKRANHLIRNGARFIATNPDKTFPQENTIEPGAGSLVSAISSASQKRPIIIGKPSPYIGKIALSKLGLSSSEIIVLGDRIDTDVLFAKRLKSISFLVLTGVSSKNDLKKTKIKPDFVFKNLSEILEFLEDKF